MNRRVNNIIILTMCITMAVFIIAGCEYENQEMVPTTTPVSALTSTSTPNQTPNPTLTIAPTATPTSIPTLTPSLTPTSTTTLTPTSIATSTATPASPSHMPVETPSPELCEDMVLTEILLETVEGIAHAGVFTCEEHGSQVVKEITCQELGVTIIDIEFNLENVEKNAYSKAIISFNGDEVAFENMEAEIKLQGGTSIKFPKKNYSIKLSEKVRIKDEWGKEKKYCLKANYVDFSQARNIVSARIYGQIVKSRNIEDEYSCLVNGGAIDGFPVFVYANGEYLGLYTFNIPKDKWLFGMKDSDDAKQAILMTNDWTESAYMNKLMPKRIASGWELEYASNEDSEVSSSTEWVSESFNKLISFVMEADEDTFREHIGDYINVERCIDSMLYTYALGAADNVAKNMLWTTFDGGKTWASSVYDLDGTWGLYWNGSLTQKYDSMTLSSAPRHQLWKKFYLYMMDDLKSRYWELRESVLGDAHISEMFEEFFDGVPQILYETEKVKWPEVKSQKKNNIEQIRKWSAEHLAEMDKVLSIIY